MMKITRRISLAVAVFLIPVLAAAQGALGARPGSQSTKRVPTVDDLLLLKSAGSPRISPDGGRVAYTMTETDWKQDAYVTQIWVAEVASGRTFQLTQGEKSCAGPDWSPDGKRIAFTSGRVGDKSQIFLIDPAGGEAVRLTNAETSVGGFEWSPDGKTIAFLAAEPAPKSSKDRKEAYGDYEVIRKEYTFNHIWTFDVAEALASPQAGRPRTKGRDFTVGSFSWSPDGTRIAFSATVNADLIQGGTADIYVLNLADDAVKKIVSQPGPDNSPQWSPDGARIVFSSTMGNPSYFAANRRLAVVPAEGGAVRALTAGFDESPSFVAWTPDGIYFSAQQKMASHLFRLDPASLKIWRVTSPGDFLGGSFSFSRNGMRMAFSMASPASLSEICVSDAGFLPRRLTDMTAQAGSFILGTREAVSWKSADGTPIEGVLIKPADFDPAMLLKR